MTISAILSYCFSRISVLSREGASSLPGVFTSKWRINHLKVKYVTALRISPMIKKEIQLVFS